MKKTSSVVTGGATFAAAGVAPLVEWLANNKFGLAMPPQVVLIVAAALVPVCHFLVNLVTGEAPGARAGSAPTTITREGGFARVGALLGAATLALAALALPGCSLMSPTIDKIEAGAMQTVVQSAERTICRDLPVGAWMAYYGTNADRIKGWQAICFNPIKAPLNDETVGAILKVYPGFQQAVDSGMAVPMVAPPVIEQAPAPAVQAPAAPAAAPARVQHRARTVKPAPAAPAPAPAPVVQPVVPPAPGQAAPAPQTSLLSPPATGVGK